MMFVRHLIFLFFAAIINAEVDRHGVLILTESDFEKTLASKKFLMVQFYAPWCDHCKELAPQYEMAAQQLASQNLTEILAKVDATKEMKVSAQYIIKGYPTLKFFKNGVVESDYDGPRLAEDIVDYVAKRANPNYKPLPIKVITLTTANFTTFRDNNRFFMLQFFKPECESCKRLALDYNKAARRLWDEEPPIPMAAVNANEEPDLVKQFNITVYPTLKLYRKGKFTDYKGLTTNDGFINYMIRYRKDVAVEIASMSDFFRERPERETVLLGYFPNAEVPLREIFFDASNDMREEFTTLLDTTGKVAEFYKLKPNSFAVIQPDLLKSKHESGITFYEKPDPTMNEVKDFAMMNMLPLLGHYTFHTIKHYDKVNEKMTVCIFFFTIDFTFDHRKATLSWHDKLADIAVKYKGRLIFAVASDDHQQEKMLAYGLEDSTTDMNVGCTTKEGFNYPMPPDMEFFDGKRITNFLESVVSGTAKIHYKSQPVPLRQTGPVTRIVGKNFEEKVTLSPNDVLVLFYSPRCVNCDKLEPTYNAVAQRLQHIKTLSMLKMDATNNQAPAQFKIDDYPTFYFKPSDTTIAFKVDGGSFKEAELLALIVKHAKASAKDLQSLEHYEKRDEL